MARSTIATFSALTTPSCCSAASCGSSRFQLLAEHRGPRPDRGGGSDPGGGVAGGELQHPDQELGDAGGAVFLRQVVGFGISDQPVID